MAQEKELRTMKYMFKLFQALSQGTGLQKIIEIGCEMLDNPLVLVDTSSRSMVISHNNIIGDRIWDEYAKNGFPSKETLKGRRNYKSFKKLPPKNQNILSPTFWNDPLAKYPRILGPVTVNETLVAHVVVVEAERSFESTDLELVEVLCNTISSEIQKNQSFKYLRGLDFEYFFKDLLDHKITDSTVINERMIPLKLNLKPHKVVLTVDISDC
ncbi:hypothetical protein OXPF_20260 [Oxobacter pfennigii]|uniref:GAF domain-containing protein n=1 Tax=Oxobacter pfennigii TaxID=36849 RepID=A0A0P8YXE5_9CLOT|nr:hypothetical protein [Oxobacter pfennigii]KPU44407.1 hypothetical protein OXPF_20260 [Oxobacter pfennigii]